jgi:hypothetical protein
VRYHPPTYFLTALQLNGAQNVSTTALLNSCRKSGGAVEGLAMLWLYIAAAGAGVLLGLLWLRALSVLAGSVVLVAITISMAARGHWPPLESVMNMFLLLATLQFSYLLALIFPPPPIRPLESIVRDD